MKRRNASGQILFESVLALGIITLGSVALYAQRVDDQRVQAQFLAQSDCRQWKKTWLDQSERQLIRSRVIPASEAPQAQGNSGLRVQVTALPATTLAPLATTFSAAEQAAFDKLPAVTTQVAGNQTYQGSGVLLVEPALTVVDTTAQVLGYRLTCFVPTTQKGTSLALSSDAYLLSPAN
ncbi:hypothetical protein [Anthocerotibacter panamensis]|uniref:hypothetical protein n=1 Tax=Anthocerotibacter panamensis TaxID=2857077 RepID=UPI001C406498|nr:hypothetical protein [Anthocerotibacter panamensis]